MADNQTMAQLLQAPTEGYEDAIVIPEINANFELKHGLINLVQNKQFFRHDKEDPHAHIRYFNKITSTMRFLDVPSTFQQRFDESFYEAWDRFNDLLRACPHHGFSELHQLDTFYNALNANDQDSLNSAAGGNFLDKMPRECLRIIESKSKVRNSRNKAVVAKYVSQAAAAILIKDNTNSRRKSKNKQFAHAISVIDFSKDEPFSGSTTIHSDALPPSSSPVKTSDNLEEFADELTLLDSFPPGNDDSVLKKDVECSDPEVDIDEIDAFLAMEVSSNFEEGYYDSEGDVIFLESLFSDDTTHNLSPEVIFDHEPKQNESIHNTSITFSPRSDPLYHEFAGEIITLPSRIAREHEEYLSLMTLLCEISTSQSPESFHANPSSIITSPIPVQEEIDIFPGDLIPPGVENDDSEDEDNSTFLPQHESPNHDHQDIPLAPRPPPEPPDVKIRLEPDTAVINNFDVLNKEACFNLEEGVQIFLPFFTYPEDSPFILSFGSEDLVFDPGIFIFHFSYLEPVVFAMEVSYSSIALLRRIIQNRVRLCESVTKTYCASWEAPHAYPFSFLFLMCCEEACTLPFLRFVVCTCDCLQD
ncbi:hypothetical protein Tco_0465973 [Tanacetum coccineum]